MVALTPDPRLLRIAEQVAVLDAPVGEPVLHQRLRDALDDAAHALIDLALGQGSTPPGASRRSAVVRAGAAVAPAAPSSAAPSPSPVAPSPVAPDRAACSAVAARCHQLAAALAPVAGIAPDTPLAGAVRTALTAVADGLQSYVQDLASSTPEAAVAGRRGLHRALRRAATALAPPAP